MWNMHYSAFRHMQLSFEKYAPKKGPLTVLDLGSRNARAGLQSHREIVDGREVDYIGIDLNPGPDVDRVMARPYTFPVKSRSVDVLFSGQTFEHIPFPWVTVLEIARVLKPGGHAFITAPSRGHQHNVYDCWRYYPDAFRALAAWSRLWLVEVFTDIPPLVAGSLHHDYSKIDSKHSYWGDTAAVLRKPASYPELRMGAVRTVLKPLANRTTQLPLPMKPDLDKRRRRVHVW